MSNFSLLIDDLRNFKDDRVVLIARNSVDALTILKHDVQRQQFVDIWLDHDLGVVGEKIDTVMPVVDFLCEQAFNGEPVKVDTIYVHTSNPVGAKTMMASLQRYGYNAVRVNASDFFIV